MAKIAVDAVLLPSASITRKAIEANKLLTNRAISLGRECCLPHISLAMGCIEESDVGEIEEALRQIAEECIVDRLKVAGIVIGTNSTGEKVSSIAIERSESLQSLHEAVMYRLKAYLSYGVTANMILSPPTSESTLRWISQYAEKSAFEAFCPHITIGYGQIDAFSFSEEFAASSLALFHLGNHCTCHRLLASITL